MVDIEIRISKCLYDGAMARATARTMSRKITQYLNLYRAFGRSAKRPELLSDSTDFLIYDVTEN